MLHAPLSASASLMCIISPLLLLLLLLLLHAMGVVGPTDVVPVALKTTSRISSVCTSMVFMHLPVATSHRRTVLSMEPDTTVSEVKLKEEEEISPSWPSSVRRQAPVRTSQMRQV